MLDKFQSEDPDILTAKAQTADNNQTALNAALTESEGPVAQSIIYNPIGLQGSNQPNTPAQAAATQTIGAALGGLSVNPDSPDPCFVASTPITLSSGVEKNIDKILLGDHVLAFDEKGNVQAGTVTGLHQHLVWEYLMVGFADGRSVGTTLKHRYWMGKDEFEQIGKAEYVMHRNIATNRWKKIKITSKIPIKTEKPVIVYNLTVKDYLTYIANGDAVHNLKPFDEF